MKTIFAKFIAFVLAVGIGVGAYFLWKEVASARRVHGNTQLNLEEAEHQKEVKAQEVEKNRERANRLSDPNDKEAIEAEARKQGFKKPGEVVYQAQKEDPQPAEAGERQ